MNNRFIFIIATIVALTGNAETPAGRVLFESDFESANAEAVPEELMVLAGEFSVKEIDGNKALELPVLRSKTSAHSSVRRNPTASLCGHAFALKAPGGSHLASVLG